MKAENEQSSQSTISNSDQDKKKEVYIEVLRVVAIIFVIFNHTSSNGFFLFASLKPTQIRFWVDMFFTVFCKFAVPMFFALSGALMLGQESIEFKKQIRRMLRTIAVLIIVSLIYYLVEKSIYNYPLTVDDFFRRLYSYRLKYHLWFLYDYIAFLITMPFINKMAKGLTNSLFYYLCILAVAFQAIIPIVEYLVFRNAFSMYSHLRPSWIIELIVLYPMVGYYLKNERKPVAMMKLLIGWLINLALILFTCWLTYQKSLDVGELSEASSQGFLSIFVIFNVIVIYETVKIFVENRRMNKYVRKMVISAGACTFGIYLFHPLILDSQFKLSYFEWCRSIGFEGLIPSFVFVLFVFVICWTGVLILKLIPGIRRLL